MNRGWMGEIVFIKRDKITEKKKKDELNRLTMKS